MLRVLTRYPRSLRATLPRLNKWYQRPRNGAMLSGTAQSHVNTVVEPSKPSLSENTHPAAPEPSNRHISVDAEGVEQVDLEFIDEPLGVPADKGHGFARFEFGDRIGPENRYKIVRKLGWGLNSSVWMAFDEQEKKYVGIKALKGYTTDLTKRGLVLELHALERVSSTDLGPTSKHCLQLLTQFTQPGQGEDGEHLCFVTELLGGDVKSLQLQGQEHNKTPLPLPLAKRILLHTLRGLAHLHRRGIVHTDLKPDNIMLDRGPLSTEDITALVAADPPRRNPPEYSWQCVIQSAVNQPLPIPPLSEAMTRTYIIADLGSAQPINVHSTDEITPFNLRAPETILRGPWDEKVDIWTFGCLVFELVVNSMLFRYEAYPAHDLDEAGALLWQMMCFTGENFKPEQLQASERASVYFNENCQLKSLPPSFRNPFAISLRNYEVLEEQDVLATATFLQRILRLDPADRPSAEELLQDPWLQGVE